MADPSSQGRPPQGAFPYSSAIPSWLHYPQDASSYFYLSPFAPDGMMVPPYPPPPQERPIDQLRTQITAISRCGAQALPLHMWERDPCNMRLLLIRAITHSTLESAWDLFESFCLLWKLKQNQDPLITRYFASLCDAFLSPVRWEPHLIAELAQGLPPEQQPEMWKAIHLFTSPHAPTGWKIMGHLVEGKNPYPEEFELFSKLKAGHHIKCIWALGRHAADLMQGSLWPDSFQIFCKRLFSLEQPATQHVPLLAPLGWRIIRCWKRVDPNYYLSLRPLFHHLLKGNLPADRRKELIVLLLEELDASKEQEDFAGALWDLLSHKDLPFTKAQQLKLLHDFLPLALAKAPSQENLSQTWKLLEQVIVPLGKGPSLILPKGLDEEKLKELLRLSLPPSTPFGRKIIARLLPETPSQRNATPLPLPKAVKSIDQKKNPEKPPLQPQKPTCKEEAKPPTHTPTQTELFHEGERCKKISTPPPSTHAKAILSPLLLHKDVEEWPIAKARQMLGDLFPKRSSLPSKKRALFNQMLTVSWMWVGRKGKEARHQLLSQITKKGSPWTAELSSLFFELAKQTATYGELEELTLLLSSLRHRESALQEILQDLLATESYKQWPQEEQREILSSFLTTASSLAPEEKHSFFSLLHSLWKTIGKEEKEERQKRCRELAAIPSQRREEGHQPLLHTLIHQAVTHQEWDRVEELLPLCKKGKFPLDPEEKRTFQQGVTHSILEGTKLPIEKVALFLKYPVWKDLSDEELLLSLFQVFSSSWKGFSSKTKGRLHCALLDKLKDPTLPFTKIEDWLILGKKYTEQILRQIIWKGLQRPSSSWQEGERSALLLAFQEAPPKEQKEWPEVQQALLTLLQEMSIEEATTALLQPNKEKKLATQYVLSQLQKASSWPKATRDLAHSLLQENPAQWTPLQQLQLLTANPSPLSQEEKRAKWVDLCAESQQKEELQELLLWISQKALLTEELLQKVIKRAPEKLCTWAPQELQNLLSDLHFTGSFDSLLPYLKSSDNPHLLSLKEWVASHRKSLQKPKKEKTALPHEKEKKTPLEFGKWNQSLYLSLLQRGKAGEEPLKNALDHSNNRPEWQNRAKNICRAWLSLETRQQVALPQLWQEELSEEENLVRIWKLLSSLKEKELSQLASPLAAQLATPLAPLNKEGKKLSFASTLHAFLVIVTLFPRINIEERKRLKAKTFFSLYQAILQGDEKGVALSSLPDLACIKRTKELIQSDPEAPAEVKQMVDSLCIPLLQTLLRKHAERGSPETFIKQLFKTFPSCWAEGTSSGEIGLQSALALWKCLEPLLLSQKYCQDLQQRFCQAVKSGSVELAAEVMRSPTFQNSSPFQEESLQKILKKLIFSLSKRIILAKKPRPSFFLSLPIFRKPACRELWLEISKAYKKADLDDMARHALLAWATAEILTPHKKAPNRLADMIPKAYKPPLNPLFRMIPLSITIDSLLTALQTIYRDSSDSPVPYFKTPDDPYDPSTGLFVGISLATLEVSMTIEREAIPSPHHFFLFWRAAKHAKGKENANSQTIEEKWCLYTVAQRLISHAIDLAPYKQFLIDALDSLSHEPFEEELSHEAPQGVKLSLLVMKFTNRLLSSEAHSKEKHEMLNALVCIIFDKYNQTNWWKVDVPRTFISTIARHLLETAKGGVDGSLLHSLGMACQQMNISDLFFHDQWLPLLTSSITAPIVYQYALNECFNQNSATRRSQKDEKKIHEGKIALINRLTGMMQQDPYLFQHLKQQNWWGEFFEFYKKNRFQSSQPKNRQEEN